MLFNSPIFLFVFAPIVASVYFILGRIAHKAAALWLVVASFVFYAYWNPPFVILLGVSIGINYVFSILIIRAGDRQSLRSGILAIAVIANISILIYFKYLVAVLGWLRVHGLNVPDVEGQVILPLGISFFTFTQLGYLIDLRAGTIKENSLLSYVLFVSFFPHLIAGPILHHREMMPQFSHPEVYRFNHKDVAAGTILFVIGLAKKCFIADHVASIAAVVFGFPSAVTLPVAWLGVLAYSIQLYFDFSGYSDMAIGLARIFGIRFPLNFNSPYKAKSIIDFWQRWHMTLTRYLTSYLYNPLTLWVTRRRLARRLGISGAALATPSGFISMIAMPLFYTMILAGIWHGAGLQFVVFGVLHAVYLTVNHAWRIFGPRHKSGRNWPVGLMSVLLTFLSVLIAQVFFRASSVGNALQVLERMFDVRQLRFDRALADALPERSLGAWSLWIVGSFAIVWILPNSTELLAKYERMKLSPVIQGFLFAGLVVLILVAASGPPVQFLYFQF
jgi:alginate O-acetyltransferase complex protein AlgI